MVAPALDGLCRRLVDIGQQQPFALAGHVVGAFCTLIHIQYQSAGKLGADIGFAFHLNVTVHQLHQFSANGQPQPGSTESARH